MRKPIHATSIYDNDAMKCKTLIRVCCLTGAFLFVLRAAAQWNENPPDAVLPQWRGVAPEVVLEDSSLVRLYERTWDIAAGRVRRGPEGMAASPYMDENCYDDQIWIWDGCFMVMFTKYAPSIFPGKETLMNYYAPIHDGVPSPLRIHLRDNPPLFAWVERMNLEFCGDTRYADMILKEKQYLQKHYHYFNHVRRGERNDKLSPNAIRISPRSDAQGHITGYVWNGGASGMDNTPRGTGAGGYDSILWVDAISQQALAADNIARLYKMRGDKAKAAEWRVEYERVRKVINDRYWDERDGFYYDIRTDNGEPCRVMTPASFWAMLAGVPSKRQAARMVERLRDPRFLGGERPWPSVARTDSGYDSRTGEYWRGGIWLPIVYMGTKALERYGYYALADSLAERVVRMQARIYENYSPHTVWECYNPNADGPSTEYGRRVRQEFCGWSALGPISLLIENVMGFRHADAATRTLTWDLKTRLGRHGIRRLTFGDVTTSLIYEPETGTVTVTANRAYTLRLNGRRVRVKAGGSSFKL